MNNENTDIIKPAAIPVLDVQDLGQFEAMNLDPAKLARLAATNVGPSGISEFKLPRIKTPQSGGTNFGLPDLAADGGSRPAPSFTAVILDLRDIRAYWPSAFDETGGVPPQCRSDNCVTGIGDPGGACVVCPMAKWGSDISKGVKKKGQACKQMKQFFLARPNTGSILPDVLLVPPTALGNFEKYSVQLLGAQQPITGVVTEFYLERALNANNVPYSRISFRRVAVLSSDADERFAAYARQIGSIWRRLNAKSLIVDIHAAPQIEAPEQAEAAQQAAPAARKEAF